MLRIRKDSHRQYLLRTARSLSRKMRREISPQQVLDSLLDLAIQDEAIYDPEDNRVLSAEERVLRQSAGNYRSRRFEEDAFAHLMKDD